MKKIRIDGVDYEVGTEAFEQAISKWQAKMDAAIEANEKSQEALLGENEKLQAKLDEALETIKKKDAEIAALPAKVAEQTKARAELESKARTVLGPKAKLDADDTKLRMAVIAKVSPEAKLDGKSPAYIEARFDAALEAFEASTDEDGEEPNAVAKARADLENVDEEGDPDDKRIDSVEAYEKMRKENSEAWKRTLKRGGIEV